MAHERILVVEDEAQIASLIERYLTRSGYAITAIVSSGEEALRQADHAPPDLALMDIHLGGLLDGVQTAEQLHARFNIPVVFLTAVSDDATVLRSRNADAFGYVLKPFQPEALKASIELALHKHKTESQLKKVEHWFAATVKSVGDGIITTDAAGRVTFLNPMAETLTDWRREMAVGQNLGQIFHVTENGAVAEVDQVVLRAVQEGGSASFARHTTLRSRTGRAIPIEATSSPIRNDQGKIIGVVLTFRDITGRKLAEEKLAEREARLRAMFETGPECVKLIAADGTLLEMNPAGLAMIEADSASQMLGRSIYPVVTPDCRPAFQELVAKAFRGESGVLEFEIVGLKHTRRWLETHSVPLRNPQGQVIAALGITRDITERKHAKAALRQSEERQAFLLRSVPINLYAAQIPPLLGVHWVSENFARLTGYDERQILGESEFWAAKLHPDDRARVRADFQKISHTGSIRTEYRWQFADGSYHWLLDQAVLSRNEAGQFVEMVGSCLDISERKRLELLNSELKDLGQRLNTATTPLAAARIMVDIAAHLFGWEACSLLLYSPERNEVRAVLCMDTINSERIDVAPAKHLCEPTPFMRQIFEGGGELILRDDLSVGTPELARFGDKTRLSASLMFVPIRNGTRVIGIFSIQSYRKGAYTLEDLATLQSLADHCGGALERLHAQEALRESEERFHAFMNHSPVVAFIKDESGRYLYGNRVWAEQFGRTAAELVGLTDFDLWPEPVARMFQDGDVQAFASDKPIELTASAAAPSGGMRHWVVLKFLIHDTPDRKLLGGLILDISERKLAEEELNRSREQLRSLAAHLQSVREDERIRIAREIHDELGQLLTGFNMDLSWLDRRLVTVNDAAARLPLLEKVKSMAGLLTEMVHSVRRISAELRPGVLDDLGLVPAMEWQAREFQTRTGMPCRFASSLGETVLTPEIGTAVFRIFQETLTNIVRHAGATRVEVTLAEQAGSLVLQVQDDGRGITLGELVKSKSFGLVGMRERAMILGGKFEIRGTPGKGTTVSLTIPLAAPSL